jgi:TetR/AcrR family transcriptional repressor of mexJK operon
LPSKLLEDALATSASRNRKSKPKSGRPPAGQMALRAETLREAAYEVFLEFGYEGAKLDEIVKRAGSSKETLYAQYANKEGLFKAVILKTLEAPYSHLEMLSSADLLPLEPALKKLSLALLAHMMTENSLRLADVVIQEASRFPEMGRMFYEFGLGHLTIHLKAYFEAHIKAGNLVDGDAGLMARQFLELTLSTNIIKSLLYVERSLTASQRRALVDVAIGCFMRLYAI